MSEPRDPARVRAQSSSPQGEATETRLVLVDEQKRLPASEPPQVDVGRQQVRVPVEFENLQLLARFLSGALILGGDELLQRLRRFQREVEAEPLRLPASAPDQETTGDLVRYLAIGLFARGQKQVARGVRRGVGVSLGLTRSILGGLDRLTDNRFARPLRQPVEGRLKALGREAAQVIDEGRLEEQNARYLAGQTVGEVIDELLDYLSENPEVADLIRRQIGAQSAGLAGVVAENTRSVTVVGDYAVEGLIRRLLRRRPRHDLPPSPYAGKPQTMYAPIPELRGDVGHDKRSSS